MLTKRVLCLRLCNAMGLVAMGLAALTQAGYSQVSETGSIGGFEAKFIDVEGVRTRYYEVGQGEPMVLVHGSGFSGTASANTWVPVLADLGERFHVFAPDKLASGLTGNPKDPEDYSLEGEMRHMADFIRTLGLEQIHLVGQSRGAGLTLLLAVEHPDLIETLVLIDSETASPPVGDYNERRMAARAPCRSLSGRAAVRCGWEALSFDPSHVTEEFVEAGYFMEMQPKSRETEAIIQTLADYPLAVNAWKPEAHRMIREEHVLQMPVLLYWGRNDPTAWLPSGLALFEMISETNSRTRMIIANEAGHFHYREHPEEFARNVINFIDHWSSSSLGH
ncbi:MAG: alpha/beta hydrolase [Gammaproteobacteria bacterium]|nr:alpha/beta hydrolase [Gammaproteobacteria bacterium]MDH3507463.1 alpha/beta hydrolase [Gammaproteobacteria bacterium]